MGTHTTPLEVLFEKMSLANASSSNYETEFPNLRPSVPNENTAELHDKTVKDSSPVSALDDKQECDKLTVTPEEQAEKQHADSDTIEALVSFSRNVWFSI